MDVGAKEDVVHIVKSLAADGMAIVVLSTEPETVLSLADRVLVMRKGEIACEVRRLRAGQQGPPAGGRLGKKTSMSSPDAAPLRPSFDWGRMFRNQLRNIAPFATLAGSCRFLLDRRADLRHGRKSREHPAPGLGHRHHRGRADVRDPDAPRSTSASVASRQRDGIVLTFFTAQPDYVNIANIPLPGGAAIVLALLACAGLGVVTRFGVTKIGIPSFIMTLAMMQIGAGISRCWCAARSPIRCPSLILTLGSKTVFGVPWIIVFAACPAGARPFRAELHALRPLRLHGRRQPRGGGIFRRQRPLIIGAVMTISAVCSGIAGMLGVAYFGSAQQNEFDTFLLDAIAAVVVGGTSLFGGRGGIGNTIVGLFVLGVLNNGLDYVKIDSFLKILIRGIILLIALVINIYAEKLRASREVGG